MTACGGSNGSSGSATSNDQSTASLLVDTLAVLGHFPAADAVQIDPSIAITAEFDGVIAQECVQEEDTWLKPDGTGTAVPGAFSFFNSGRSFRFQPNVPLELETDYVFQLSALTCDVDGKLLEEEYRFTFRTLDSTPPVVTSVNVPGNATNVSRTTDLVITFNEAVGAESVTPATVYLRDVFGTNYTTTNTVSGATITVDPDVALPGDRQFVLVAVGGSSGVEDRAGNVLESSWSTSFRTAPDTLPPTIVSTWPQGATNASPRIQPLIGFSDSMDPLSVESASVIFADEFSNLVPYQVFASPDQQTLRLVTKLPLITGRNYAITFLSGPGAATDISGNALATLGVVTFKVGSDSTPPSLTGGSVADNQIKVSPNVRPTLTFNDSLDPSRIDTTRVTLSDPNGLVAAAVTLEQNNTTIRIAPAQPLAPSTRYEMRMRGGFDGIRDAAGNYPTEDVVRAFTTSGDATPPEFLLAPINGSAAISRDTTISATSVTPLDPATVGSATVYLQDSNGALVSGNIQLGRSNRVIRVVPESPLSPGETYVFTLLGGRYGVREASGNWLDTSVSSTFRIASLDDITPPTVVVSLNETNPLRNIDRTMPPFGFEINVSAIDTDTFNQDMASVDVELTGPSGLSAESVFATAELTESTLKYRLPFESSLNPGTYTLLARVADLSGNVGTSDPLSFQVSEPTNEVLPFERTQVVWVRYELDRDGNSISDFEDDLERLGLITAGDPAGTNARMIELVRDGIISRAHQLYHRKPNGGRQGVDSVAIRFTHRQPLGVPSMQIACGGFDPDGPPGRTYGDETSGTLGRAFYDYRNQQVNDNNTATNPAVGVFPAELFLYETEIHQRVYPSFVTTFARGFLPLAPAMGGTPVGSHPDDAAVVDPNFVYELGTTTQRARFNSVFAAADDWATAIGTILSHEVGHSLGLVAPGQDATALHGDQSLHNEFASINDVMGAAVGYDGLVTLGYRFRDLNLAYLRHRMLLK